MSVAGATWRTIRGASCEPMTKATADGTDHSPATSGESPATSCRYCAMNRK